jgi:hypothetical protein
VYLHVTEIKPWHWLFAAGMAARLDARAEVPIYPLAARQTAAQTVPELADYISGVIETVGAQNVAVLGRRSWPCRFPILMADDDAFYLRLCGILIEMANAFFSSSWRIL